MDSLIDRIVHIAELEGISIAEMERNIGACRGTLSRAIHNRSDLQSKWLIHIVENYPQYSPSWILTGVEPMLKGKEQNIHDRMLNIIERQEATIQRQQQLLENLMRMIK